ncbi:sigma-54-dependent Fis family transcriptional regulator [Vibrio ponticus]|uniref:Sigma-54-dependent Fis family transcriptional regulator n=1 Tax=Vibrio ponticus TaxID=265668 RepID=A0ABX3FA47_9VIBR|nr:sigma 54-interacting transcriptional regulator [Vibrio ponticus]OLQ87851.1 sigma-54-dependent Fis family transcriptional regulator [Vibrio ponticus]
MLVEHNNRRDVVELELLPQEQEAKSTDKVIRYAWEQFIEGGQPNNVRPSILASWQRSLKNNIDPETFVYRSLPEDELATVLLDNRELISVARKFMQDLLYYNPDGHINLTDNHGTTLCYCGSDLTPVGSILHEEELGTNCTALCLRKKKLVYVLSAENWKFHLRDRRKQCAAAPIMDSKGTLIGVLTLTATQENFNTHTLGTVQAAAHAIEQQLRLKELLAEQRLILETLNEGVIVIDDAGIIKNINRYAKQIFSDLDLLGRNIDRVLKPEDESMLRIHQGNDHEVLFRPSSNKSINCLISVMEMNNGNRVISLREDQRIKRIARKVLGGNATYTFDRIMGNSDALKETVSRAKVASRSQSTILITGESGTGKELFAQSIHNHSERADGPFIALNCGAIPKDLVQSELFGYVEGAYTGARGGGAAGKFELADGGTLFLDEIGEMPLEAQTSLLRVIQESEVIRIGSSKPKKIDVRIIAATNRDLVNAIDDSMFRRDLYYRLNVISIHIPPLRHRDKDIRDLIEYFSVKMCNTFKKMRPSISSEALEALCAYTWPGNVRELENVIERLINLNKGLAIQLHDLPDEIQLPPLPVMTVPTASEVQPFTPHIMPVFSTIKVSLESNERQHIINLLKEFRGNIRKTATTLSISRNSLYCKLKKWDIKIHEYRQ